MVLNHMFVPGKFSAHSVAAHTGKECGNMIKNMGLGHRGPGFKSQCNSYWHVYPAQQRPWVCSSHWLPSQAGASRDQVTRFWQMAGSRSDLRRVQAPLSEHHTDPPDPWVATWRPNAFIRLWQGGNEAFLGSREIWELVCSWSTVPCHPNILDQVTTFSVS